MSIARQIAMAHKGRLSVESIVEKGSTFVVELPMGGASEFFDHTDHKELT